MQDQLQSAKQYNNSPYAKVDEYNQANNNQQSMPSPYDDTNSRNPNINQNQNQQFASDLNKLHRRESSIHCQALIATILLLAGEFTGIFLYLGTDVGLPFGGMLGICFGSYALYLIVGFCCNPLSQYLGHINKGQTFQQNYEQVRGMNGYFWFSAECYHYEVRHHTRTHTDSNGHTKHQHYTTTEKVVTHTASENHTPSFTKDESGAVEAIRASTNIVFLHFIVRHRFSDRQSQNNFENLYQGFKYRNTRDTHQAFSFGYKLRGLVERQAFYIGDLGCNYSVLLNCFGIFGLLWPYSLWVQSKITRFTVDIMKVLTF